MKSELKTTKSGKLFKKTKYKRNSGYYYEGSYEGSEIYYCDDAPKSDHLNFYGPYKTFTECKKEAISYHRTDLTTARNAIRNLMSLKKKDVDKL